MSVTPIPSRNASRLATPLRTSPVQAARTPREWLAVLEERLRKQQDEVDVYERYFVGDHPLRFATTKFKEVFGNLFGAFSDNWNELIVLASVERLEVTGFRTGVNDEGDAAIWRRWQENNLDNGSVLAHTEAVKTGRAYVIVNSSSTARSRRRPTPATRSRARPARTRPPPMAGSHAPTTPAASTTSASSPSSRSTTTPGCSATAPATCASRSR
jgi:hypothetical protein